MTRDELRQKCIEAMAKAIAKSGGEPWDDILQYIKNEYIFEATAAFDALHCLVRVVPIEVTEEMIQAVGQRSWDGREHFFERVTAAGDLTRLAVHNE